MAFRHNECYYEMIRDNEENTTIEGSICFSGLSSCDSIKINRLDNKKTLEYQPFYLQYIADMLDLKEVTIEDTSFQFKAYPDILKNLLVCSLVRVLYEKIGNSGTTGKIFNVKFLKDLQNKDSKYENKLERFCDIYRNIKGCSYWQGGHNPEPKHVVIRTTTEFSESKKIEGVNKFFYE
jgi:hypothetical protein